ncbi:hypothetical protein [Hymenobacter chitinivorans]|uniref:Uncharacterized protein n=1 Tax=Hymenobacter chitinivorans DSM 11115 TaxID=1121954 RepID=A0A2M9BT18_9BACT|nr:hypothetical protein [Hymenobacter chitinivorans]PJJ61099.1 hypothetical protein CLV45_2537 [Hymenobacter chitinivorans DSM 11115]
MAKPTEYPPHVFQALYTDEAGEVIGLDEVQLLDPVPAERIPALTALLASEDVYLAYQCGLVLAAWGVEAGVKYLGQLVDTRIDKLVELEPHRLWGEDNVYDVIAEALGIAVLSDYDPGEILLLLGRILELYGECYFESKLKATLLRSEVSALLPAIKKALQLALEHNRYYQASQLLPVLAKYDKTYALAQVAQFEQLVGKDDRIRYNLEEMREYS